MYDESAKSAVGVNVSANAIRADLGIDGGVNPAPILKAKMRRLQEMLERLDSHLSELGVKLGPVLSPEEPTDTRDPRNMVDERVPQSELAHHIQDRIEHAESMIDRMNSLLVRLEL